MSSITIFAENRNSGARPTGTISVGGQQKTFAQLLNTSSVQANAIGVNGQAPSNVTITVSGNGKNYTVNDNGTPIDLGSVTDISHWTIVAKQN